MAHFLYIIHSPKKGNFYVGETPDVDQRLKLHRKHQFKNAYTAMATDWELALSKKCASKEDALYLERFVKRMKSRVFIEKVIARPEILDDILGKRK